MVVENEYKFTSDRTDADHCLSSIDSFMREIGADYSKSIKSNTDLYYDSEGMEITAKGCFIRKRTSSDRKCKLTVKRPIYAGDVMSREEIERTSDGSFQSVQDFCSEYFPGIVLNKEPVLVNKSERTVFSFNDGSKTKLLFDKCQYMDGTMKKDYLEIELEIISDTVIKDFDRMGVVCFVTENLGFTSVTESKYARGLRWKGLTE